MSRLWFQASALEERIFNVSFSKRFPEFWKPTETSGATGEKLLPWVKIHQRWLVSAPPDLATVWPDSVIGRGGVWGKGLYLSFRNPRTGLARVLLLCGQGGSSPSSATAVPPGAPAGRQAGCLSGEVAVGHTASPSSVCLPSSSVWASETRTCCLHPQTQNPPRAAARTPGVGGLADFLIPWQEVPGQSGSLGLCDSIATFLIIRD